MNNTTASRAMRFRKPLHSARTHAVQPCSRMGVSHSYYRRIVMLLCRRNASLPEPKTAEWLMKGGKGDPARKARMLYSFLFSP